MPNFVKVVVLLVFLIVSGGLFTYKRCLSVPLDKKGGKIEFVVSAGEGVKRIAKNLEEKGIIRSAKFFEFYTWKLGKQGSIKAGRYELSPAMSIEYIVPILEKGGVSGKQMKIRFIEGWNLRDIGGYFESKGIFQREEFMEIAGFPVVDYRKEKELPRPVELNYRVLDDKPDYVGYEGYIYPDTYMIYTNASVEDVLKKSVEQLDLKISDEMLSEIRKQGKTFYEILTMASIIEKEVRTDKDKRIVAGILYKRMEIGMRLQVDSTVNYVTGKNDPSVSYSDLEVESLYNTYKNNGLPPGPICNPGIKSIEAAIYPEKSPYLFYLNRQDTDVKETIFSIDYTEHLKNKAKYLK